MADDPYQIALAVLQKIVCALSTIGSLMIISQISRDKIIRSKTQQRLLFSISLCNFFVSFQWIFTALFVPPQSGWERSFGNENTCEAQGFIIQITNGSNIWYIVALQLQYLLTIKYGWSEKKIKKIEPVFHGISLSFGLGTAIAALVLKLYNFADWHCWIAPSPLGCTSTQQINKGMSDLQETDCVRGDNADIFQWAFFYGFLWPAILFCMFVMFQMVKSVEAVETKTAGRAARYMNNADTQQTPERPKLVMTEQVRKQCMLYSAGFFVVWTFPTISRIIELFGGSPSPLLILLSGTFVGSQGAWNAMIYFRPKYNKMEKKHWLKKIWALSDQSLVRMIRNLLLNIDEFVCGGLVSQFQAEYVLNNRLILINTTRVINNTTQPLHD